MPPATNCAAKSCLPIAFGHSTNCSMRYALSRSTPVNASPSNTSSSTISITALTTPICSSSDSTAFLQKSISSASTPSMAANSNPLPKPKSSSFKNGSFAKVSRHRSGFLVATTNSPRADNSATKANNAPRRRRLCAAPMLTKVESYTAHALGIFQNDFDDGRIGGAPRGRFFVASHVIIDDLPTRLGSHEHRRSTPS